MLWFRNQIGCDREAGMGLQVPESPRRCGTHGAFARCLALVVGAIVGGPVAALEPVADFGANPGELELFVHAPDGPTSNLPVVMALHGCRQQASDFDDETGLIALAEAIPFILMLPQQRRANNERRCFNWFRRPDNRPGRGESASLRNMLDTVIARHDADPEKVYVLGLSAGGAMTGVMLANHPERFAGGAIIAGTPYDCNRPQGFTGPYWWWLSTVFGDAAAAVYACGIFGYNTSDRSAATWGDYVRDVAAETPEAWPPVSIWQGGADDTVDPDNLDELIEQWTNVHGIDGTPDVTETVGEARRTVFMDAQGEPRVEAWRLPGFLHAVPVDPDAEPAGCGMASEFIRDADLCAVRRIAAFWGLGG